jgi:hypothetical protein
MNCGEKLSNVEDSGILSFEDCFFYSLISQCTTANDPSSVQYNDKDVLLSYGCGVCDEMFCLKEKFSETL